MAERGTTLVETLVALLVVGLVIGVLSQGTWFGLLALHRADRERAVGGDLETVDRALRQAILSMDPGTYTEPPTFLRAPGHSRSPPTCLRPITHARSSSCGSWAGG